MNAPSSPTTLARPTQHPNYITTYLHDGISRTSKEMDSVNSAQADARTKYTINLVHPKGYDANLDNPNRIKREIETFEETMFYMISKNTERRPRLYYYPEGEVFGLNGEAPSAMLGWFPSLPFLLLPDLAPSATHAKINSVYGARFNYNAFGLLPENALDIDSDLLRHVRDQVEGLRESARQKIQAVTTSPHRTDSFDRTHIRMAVNTQALEDLIEMYEIPAKKTLALLKKARNDMWLLRVAYFRAVYDDVVRSPLHYKRISQKQLAFMEDWKETLKPAYERLKAIRDVLEAPMQRLNEATAGGPFLAARIFDLGNPFEKHERKQLAVLLKQHAMWALFAPARFEEVLVRAGAPALPEIDNEISFEDFTEISNRTLLEFQQEQARG